MHDTETLVVSDGLVFRQNFANYFNYPNILITTIILMILVIPKFEKILIAGRTRIGNKTPCFLSTVCPEFAGQCKIINGNGLLDLFNTRGPNNSINLCDSKVISRALLEM